MMYRQKLQKFGRKIRKNLETFYITSLSNCLKFHVALKKLNLKFTHYIIVYARKTVQKFKHLN